MCSIFVRIQGESIKFEVITFTSDVKSSKKDVDVFIELKQVDRDTRAVFGHIDIQRNITDKTFFQAKVLFSPTGANDYELSPVGMPKVALSTFANVAYKNFLKAYAEKCATNLPQFDTLFVAPLTPRRIELNGCLLSPHVFPEHSVPGFYKIQLIISGEVDIVVESLLKIE